jgi:hypothetical protein
MDDRLFTEAQLVEGTADRARHEVVIDLIREGFGNKRDNHYYGRQILEAHADQFNGTKMYVDHLDPEVVKRMNGMPRSVRDLGGRIVEAYLAENDNGQTVIRGKAKIAQNWLWELIENDPEILGVSINAWGKSKPGQIDGREAQIVEGISKVGSVDWVTEAGAGGKVVSLVEAQLEQEEAVAGTTITDLTTERLMEERPDLVEALLASLSESDGEDDGDDEVDEVDDDDAGDADESSDDENSGTTTTTTTKTETQEADAVCDECGRPLSEGEFTADDVEERAMVLAQEKLEEAVSATVDVLRERFEDELLEMQAEHDRQVGQLTQRHRAAQLIEQAGFKPPTEKALKEQFHDAYFEGDYDDEGEEIKSPDTALEEAVKAAIDAKRQELSAYVEHRVTGAGETDSLTESSNGGRRRPLRESPVDKSIDAELGIESSSQESTT